MHRFAESEWSRYLCYCSIAWSRYFFHATEGRMDGGEYNLEEEDSMVTQENISHANDASTEMATDIRPAMTEWLDVDQKMEPGMKSESETESDEDSDNVDIDEPDDDADIDESWVQVWPVGGESNDSIMATEEIQAEVWTQLL